MEKLDRLGWAEGLCLQSYGLRLGVRVNRPMEECRDQLLERLPPGWTTAEPPFVDQLYSLRLGGAKQQSRTRYYHLLYSGLQLIARSMDLEEVFAALERDMQSYVAEWARERLFVHAGVVGWRGKALLIPGRSFTGKSTLVTALLKAGATYYSDEYAVLDAQGLVHSYPRRLQLRQNQGPSLRPTAAQFGATVGTEPLPVGLIAMTRYRERARWQPRDLSPGKAFLEMLDNSVPALSRPRLTMLTLQQVTPRCRNVKGVRGEAEATADLILQSLAA